jgi:predicted O-linked N-acetylglucosamine transferase (SPINDLY family)
MGKGEAALALYDRALARPTASREIWFNYANLLQRLGRPAEEALRRALPLHPAQVNLANLLRDAGRFEDAEELYRSAMAAEPGHPLAFANLGVMLVRRGRDAEAVPLLRRALALEPGRAQWWNALGYALRKLARPDEAIACWQKAIAADAGSVDAYNNLGAMHRLLHRPRLAIECLERAHRLAPHDAEVEANLANALMEVGRVSDAERHADQILARDPGRPEAHLMRGFALVHQARIEDGFDAFMQAHRLAPDQPSAIGNALFSSLYGERRDAAALLDLHRDLAARIVPSAEPRGDWARDRSADRTLRVGYVSPDLRSHPVGFFFEPVLTHHDRERVTAICYSSSAPDAVTDRLRRHAALWRDGFGKDNDALLAMIEADRVDILVDLSGHTAQNRAAVFRARPAPVQVLYIGYPGTSGLPEIDWLIADRQVCPTGHERFYSERVARVDGSFWCWQPPDDAPDPGPPPSASTGRVTFGSYNNLPKLSDATVRLWSAILRAVPASRLVLKALSFADERVREATRARFAAAGLDASRIETLAPTFERAQFFAEYQRIDIALDPMPYGGGATSCEALWMGLPIVTLAGDAFCSRMTTSFLHSLGLDELVARNAAEYQRIAVALAGDAGRLAAWRAGLRSTMARSALCDGRRAARALEDAFRRMWLSWLRGD